MVWTSIKKHLDPQDPIASQGRSIQVFLRKPTATCDFPGGKRNLMTPCPTPLLDLRKGLHVHVFGKLTNCLERPLLHVFFVILGNQGVIHSIPTAFIEGVMHSVPTVFIEGVIHSVPTAFIEGVMLSVPTAFIEGVIHSVLTAFINECSVYGMDNAWATQGSILPVIATKYKRLCKHE